MTKKARKTGKRCLALFMTVLMLMSAWVFVAPTASAAAGNYTLVLNYTIDNAPGGSSYLKVNITYKTNNGTGSETSTGDISIATNSSPQTVTVAGWPTKVSWKAKGQAWDIYKGHFTSATINGAPAWSGNSGWDSGGGFTAFEKSGSFDLSATAPYMASLTISGTGSHTIPKTGASNLTSNYTVSAAYDQYGVQWYTEPTSTFWINASQPANASEAAHDTATGCSISGSGTLTVTSSAQIAGTTNSKTVYVSCVNGSAWGTKAVTLNDPKYTVKFYDGNNAQFGSTQSIYYGCDATKPSGTPVKDPDADNHYTFSSWGTYTNITTDTNVNASFNSASHTGTWGNNTATCTAGGTETRTCPTCGYVNTRTSSALGHNWVTTVSADHLKSAATCTSPAVYYKWCSRCGANHPTDTFTNGSALGHDFTGAYQNVSDGRHNRKCSRCNEYGIGSGTSATVNGTEACSGGTANCVDKAVCQHCNTVYGVVDPANHKSTENRAAVANSCETDGYTAGVYCTACNQWVSGHEPVAAKGHDYTGAIHSLGNGTHNWACKNNCGTYGKVENGTQVKDGTVSCDATYGAWSDDTATCLEGGSHSRTCSECGYTQTEATSQLGHNWVTTVSADHLISAANCETPATYHKWCSRCGANHPSETFTNGAALGHNYTGAAHNLGNGTHNWACKNGCGTYGKVEGETQVKNGVVSCDATYGAWSDDTATCTAAGSQSRTCSVCGYVQTRTTDPLNHHWVETANENHKVSDATCEVAKTYHKWCDRCGDDHPTDTFTVGNPLGHDYTGAPRDNGDGTHSWLCKKGCGTYGKVEGDTQVKNGKTGHTYGDFYDVHDATCTEEGSQTHKCTVCNKVETLPIPTNDNHDWDDGEITTPANCHDLGVKTFTCSRCGATKTEDVAINPNNHKHLVRTAPVDNGCENDGNIEYWFCDGCNKYYSDAAATQQITQADTVLAATGHDFSADASRIHSMNDGTHNWVCANGCGACGKVENNTQVKDGTVSCDATYGNWTTDTATCTAGGSHSRTCSACGYVQTEETPELGHRWVTTVSAAHKISDADCEHAAKYHKWCSRCGIDHETDTFTDGDPLGHDFTDTPHDLGNGTHNWKCSRCNEYGIVENGEQVKNGSVSCADTYGDWETVVQNDCVNGGSEKRTCAVCGHVETKDTNPLGHLFTKQTVSDATLYQVATCNSKARYWYSCARCNEIERDDNHTFESGEFDPNNHNYVFERTVDPWCETQGYDIYRCSRCGDTQNRNFVDPLNHTWGAWESISSTQHKRVCERDANHSETENHDMQLIETIAPTCEAIGYEVWTCSVCGYSEHREEQAALGHDFTGDVRDNDNGTHSFKCTHEGCGKYGVGTGAGAEVNGSENCQYGAWSEDTATCLVGGSHTKVCDVCGHSVTEATPPLGHKFDAEIVSADTLAVRATCTEQAEYYYTCSREGCGEIQRDTTKTFKAGDPLGHDWETEPPVYLWENNNTRMTATLYCGNDKNHSISETVTAAKVVTKEPTCTEKGVATYTATFANDPTQNEYNYTTSFTTQTTTSDVDKLPHTLTDDTHHAAVDPTCTEPGNIEYWICEVCGGYFEDVGGYYPTTAEGVVLPIDPDAHNWGDWTDNGADNHKRVCSRDEENHVETEAHSWKDIYSEDLIVGDKNVDPCTGRIECYQTCEVCGRTNDADHTFVVSEGEGHKMPLTHHEATVATCVTAGNSEYYECSVCGKYFSDAEGTQPIADKSSVIVQPSGHNWGTTPAWYWVKNGDSYDVTAVFTCTRDMSHKQNITATVTPDAANHPATCEEDGASTWNAVATFNGVDYTDSKSETTPAIGHKYIHVKEGSWVWTESDGAYTVKVTLVCDNDSTHEIERDALVSYTTDAPNCTTPGTRHYTAAVALDNGTMETDTKDSVVPVVGHSMVATAKKDATCDEAGYEAYWTCSVCGKLFSDANGEHEITAPVVINAKGHTWGTPEYSWEKRGNDYYVTATVTCTTDTRHVVTETVKAVGEQTKDPTCTEKGETTYTATFAKEQFSTQTKDVQDIPTVAHTLTKTEAVEATCTVEGFDAYWTCSECGKIFSDENGDHEISEVTKALDPDNHKTLVHTAKVDATCLVNGNIEYWTCNDCHQKLVYNDAGKLVEVTDVVIPAGPAHHRFTTHVSEKAATCTQQGNVEYWTCSVCGKHFNGNTESATELTNVSTAPLGHDVTKTAAKAATCTEDGNLEYWYCARCHQYFLADSITAEPVAFSATVDPKKGHTAVSVDAVAVQCEADGNKAYSYCSVCDTILTLDGVDVSLNGWTRRGNSDVYTITQTGHAYGNPTWTWNDDHTSATATRICANDPTHTVSMTDNEIESVIIDKTHTTDGKATYTAEVTFAYDNKTFTDVVEIVDTASGHHTTKVDAKDATCEATGNLEYWICNDEGCGKLFKDENALVETTLEAVTLEALGHNYVNPTWTWTQNGNFYTGATLTFTCANDATHKQTPEVTFTADQTNPDCTNAGKIVYTATATFEGKTYTDTKEVTLEKAGHTLSATAAKDATCLADGNIAYWTCSVCNKIFSDKNARYEITAADTVIPALGHTYNYANAAYNWNADHSSCTATATCIRCDATDTETKASTNNVKIPATCEAQGIGIYTVDFDNANFATQTYDELIPATGHGTAVMHEGKAATCEAAGFEAYWTCSVCGKLFKAETLTAENEIANPIVIPATGHDWDYTKENITYTWSNTEPYTCTATVTCKNDGTHTKDVTGSVTITDSTEANCTTDGSRTYTATFPADTSIPNDTKTATTPALGHDFSESVDRAHVVDGTHHNYKCVRCDAYGIMDGEEAKANESVACTFHGDWLVSENETCTEAGSEWRKCDFCSNKETREREALSHKVFSVDAKDATCVAIGNKAYTYCERCGLLLTVDGTSVEDQNVKFNTPEAITLYKTEDPLAHNLTATVAKAATCEEDGNIAYWTCSLCGKIFNIENPTAETTAITLTDTVIPATKHDFTGAVRDNGDNTHSKKCTKCDAYGIMVNGTPVKDGKEACYGGNATCTDDAICSVCGHTYQAKSGHNYVLQSWTWTGYTAATAHYVCANDATHKKDVEATVNKTDATVTCTAAGQNTYVATATFTDGDKTYTDTDTKTEVVNATGHNWDFENAVYSWDANQNCTVTLKCLNDEEHVYTEIGKNTTATTPATCEGTGSVKYTATFTINSTLTSEHTETLAALGHKWGDPAWTWTGNDTDGYTATVKLVCDRVASHEATPDVTVTKDTVAPTCEKDGRTVYTATATLDGRTYKDTKITIQPAKGHDWQAPVFTWTEAENGGYSAATALIACNNDPAHNQTLNCALTTETDNATCTEGGTVTYTATVTFNGRTYTEKKTAEVTALGHKYAFVDFTWTGNDADGYTAAVANFKCANDPTHTTTAAATVTTEKVDAICEADGKITYTANVTFEGKEYTDEKVVVLPMLHHDWGDATYTWVKDGDQYKVTALRVCANNPDEHQQTVTVTTTSEITASSGCESEGTILYTATFEAPFATQTREESVAVAGHTLVHTDYLDSTCTKAGNIEYWRCSVCGKIFTDEAATGDSYLGTDLAATVIAAKDHDFVMEGKTMVVLDNEDGTHSFKCSRCDAYGAVIDGVQTIKENGGFVPCVYGKWTVTRKPTCMDPGEQKATCKICGHVEFKEVGYADHVIVRISAKSAKCEADGNKEYFKCNVCGKLFADAAATTETSLEAVTLPKLGHNFTGAIHNDGNGTTHSYLCVNGCGTYGNPQAHEFDQQIASQTYLRNVATCTEPATYYLSCKCGQASTQTFTKGNALGHNDVVYTGQPATCTQAGHTEYTECTRCHRRDGYQVIDALNHGAYLPNGTGASADGSLKWTVYKCDHNCGDYYVVLNVTSIDAQGTRVPNVNVTITGNNTNITGKTDGNGDLKLSDEAKYRLMPGVYTVALEYVRDGSNYNTRGTVTVKDGTVTGSYGKLTPYGGNASGSMGGEPTGEFRCSMCNTYESTKNVPVYGWFISIIHFFVHMISRIGK